MKYKIDAFTLTELLIALGIIGTIAAISIPSLMNNINNKLLATQIKSNTVAFQQLISDQLVINKTKTLEDTDMASEEGFYKHLDTVSTCSSTKKCWADSYTTIPKTQNTWETLPKNGGVLLKNGAAVKYEAQNVKEKGYIAKVYIDTNGVDYPNIIGRDLFGFYITKDAKIQGDGSPNPTPCDSTTECLTALIQNNWTMPKDSEYYVKN